MINGLTQEEVELGEQLSGLPQFYCQLSTKTGRRCVNQCRGCKYLEDKQQEETNGRD